MSEGEFRVLVNPIKKSKTPIKSFFNGCNTLPIVAPSEGVSNKPKIHQTKLIYESSEWTVRRTCNRSTSQLFRLV